MDTKTLFFIAAALIFGILIGSIPGIPLIVSSFPVILSFSLFCLNIFITQKNPFASTATITFSSALLLFMGIGIFASILSRPGTTRFIPGTYTFSGTITEYVPTTWGDRVLIDLSSLHYVDDGYHASPVDASNIKAMVTLSEATSLSFGDKISGTVKMNPIDSPDSNLYKDYITYLKNQNIYLRGFAKGDEVSVIPSNNIFYKPAKVRYNLEAAIEGTGLSTATKSFLISILLGDKSYLSSSERLSFADAGVAHIFAVSGLHVSMVAIFLLAIASLFFHSHALRWKFIICIPIVWIYILITGCSPATCRAGIMITIGFMAFFLQRKNNSVRNLLWAVILILAFRPDALFDIGFQLSVICVGSIILMVSPLNFINQHGHPRLYKAVSAVLITIIATLSSWMLCAFYFHRFSLMFLPLNLLAVPLLPIFLIMSIVYLLMASLGLPLVWLGKAIDSMYAFFLESVEYLNESSLPIVDIHPDWFSLAFWIIGVGFTGYILHKKAPRRYLLMPSTFLLLGIISLLLFPAIPE